MRSTILLFIVATFLIISCEKEATAPIETGSFTFNFTANYNDAPLVINEGVYDYNGKPIRFSKVHFYLSDITIGETELFEVTLIDLTKTHLDQQSSRIGTALEFSKVPIGDYSSFAFGVGVSPDLNRTKPEDYATNHPLGIDNGGEYWEAWDSYIFVKIEGQYDIEGDGFNENDIAFAYHIGQDEMYKKLSASFESPIALTADKLANIDFKLDIKKLFVQPDGQLMPHTQHDPNNQLEAMQIIMDNFKDALTFNL